MTQNSGQECDEVKTNKHQRGNEESDTHQAATRSSSR